MTAINWKELPSREIMPGFHGRFVHTENTTVAYWEIEKGAELPEHQHVHEQTALMISGEFELTVEGIPFHLKPNSAFPIPSNVRHSGKAFSDCVIIDIFSPVRNL